MHWATLHTIATDALALALATCKDGLGSRLHEVIASMAIAASMRMALGGVIFGKKTCQVSRGLNILEAAGSFFGIEDASLMFKQVETKMDQIYPTLGKLQKSIKTYGRPSRASIFLSSNCLACAIDHGNASSWYTPRLLSELRKAFVWNEPLSFKTGSTSIAIHIRRGDVNPDDKFGRGTSDQLYVRLIEQLSEGARARRGYTCLQLPGGEMGILRFRRLPQAGRQSSFGRRHHRGVGPLRLSRRARHGQEQLLSRACAPERQLRDLPAVQAPTASGLGDFSRGRRHAAKHLG